MRNILLVSHGTMAKGVCQAAKMICGNMGNINYICLEEDMGIELFKSKLSELIDSIKDSDEIVALADLKGGSPYTSTVTLLSEKGLLDRAKVISGLNLPMLLTVLFNNNKLDEKEVQQIIGSAREAIEEFKIDDDEDNSL